MQIFQVKYPLGYLDVIVDDEDWRLVERYHWNAKFAGNWYIFTRNQSTLHRMVLGLSKGDGKEVDHINGNTCDNRRCNLRIVTHQQNCANSKKHKEELKFKGVYADKDKWRVHVANKYIGTYIDEIEAARAYNKAAIERWGEFALLNKV